MTANFPFAHFAMCRLSRYPGDQIAGVPSGWVCSKAGRREKVFLGYPGACSVIGHPQHKHITADPCSPFEKPRAWLARLVGHCFALCLLLCNFDGVASCGVMYVRRGCIPRRACPRMYQPLLRRLGVRHNTLASASGAHHHRS